MGKTISKTFQSPRSSNEENGSYVNFENKSANGHIEVETTSHHHPNVKLREPKTPGSKRRNVDSLLQVQKSKRPMSAFMNNGPDGLYVWFISTWMRLKQKRYGRFRQSSSVSSSTCSVPGSRANIKEETIVEEPEEIEEEEEEKVDNEKEGEEKDEEVEDEEEEEEEEGINKRSSLFLSESDDESNELELANISDGSSKDSGVHDEDTAEINDARIHSVQSEERETTHKKLDLYNIPYHEDGEMSSDEDVFSQSVTKCEVRTQYGERNPTFSLKDEI